MKPKIPASQRKTASVQVMTTNAEREAWRKLARANGTNLSAWAREVIHEAISKEKP